MNYFLKLYKYNRVNFFLFAIITASTLINGILGLFIEISIISFLKNLLFGFINGLIYFMFSYSLLKLDRIQKTKKEVNISRLFSLMKKKGYYYMDGNTNSRCDDIFLTFSTGHQGRGKYVEITLKNDDSDSVFIRMERDPKAAEYIKKEQVISFLENNI